LFAVEENRDTASVADFAIDDFVTIHNQTLASWCGAVLLSKATRH